MLLFLEVIFYFAMIPFALVLGTVEIIVRSILYIIFSIGTPGSYLIVTHIEWGEELGHRLKVNEENESEDKKQ